MPPENALFLPPGVVPPSAAAAAPAVAGGPPFNREFFEQVLPMSVKAFCGQVGCEAPIVELHTVDGLKHFVKAISGVSDSWVALHTRDEEHDHDVQIFVAFGTIFRVEIHPEEDEAQRKLGFLAIRAADEEEAEGE